MNVNFIKLNKAEKAIEYLEVLSKNLKNLKFDKTEGFVIESQKVSYFNILSSEYQLYDFKEFNYVMGKTYHNLILDPKIKNNKIFNDLISVMNTNYNNSKYHFYDDIYTTFHLVSWFVKSLRYSKNKKNKFDINTLMSNFPVPFLEKEVSLDENLNFIIDYLNLLQKVKKIQIINLELSFINFDQFELDEILNVSFEQLVFGGNLNTDKYILIQPEIDNSIMLYRFLRIIFLMTIVLIIFL